VAWQWVLAGEGSLIGLAAEARSIVGHEGDRGRDDVDDLADGLVDQLDGAAVGAQIVEKFPRPAPLPPGIPSSIAALPASTKRLRHRLIDSVETPWRRAASAIE
jgi:hypothetical protein